MSEAIRIDPEINEPESLQHARGQGLERSRARAIRSAGRSEAEGAAGTIAGRDSLKAGRVKPRTLALLKIARRGAADYIGMEGEFKKYLDDVYSEPPLPHLGC